MDRQNQRRNREKRNDMGHSAKDGPGQKAMEKGMSNSTPPAVHLTVERLKDKERKRNYFPYEFI